LKAFLLVIVLSGLQITASDSPLGSSNFSCPFSVGYCVVTEKGQEKFEDAKGLSEAVI
jgi:hypothetical protein